MSLEQIPENPDVRSPFGPPVGPVTWAHKIFWNERELRAGWRLLIFLLLTIVFTVIGSLLSKARARSATQPHANHGGGHARPGWSWDPCRVPRRSHHGHDRRSGIWRLRFAACKCFRRSLLAGRDLGSCHDRGDDRADPLLRRNFVCRTGAAWSGSVGLRSHVGRQLHCCWAV